MLDDFASTDYKFRIWPRGMREEVPSMANSNGKGSCGIPDVIAAPRTDPIYNCHAYLTKVPVAAILPFIDEFTKPGDLVVDVFAGSGMTGIAAAMHGRRAHLSDISVLGQHIALGYLTEVGPAKLREVANKVTSEARKAIGDFYRTERAEDGTTVEMVRTVWSFTYVCPKCKYNLVYFKHLGDDGKEQPKTCPECSETFVRRSWPRGEDVPVQVVVDGVKGKQVEQPPAARDLETIEQARRDKRQDSVPNLAIDATREMYGRSALGKHDLTETKRFFSPRNAIALLELWRAIDRVDDKSIQRKLRFAFTAILPRASRRYQWGPLRPLNAQNQTYYIAPVYFEWNVFELFNRKVEAAVRSDEEIFRGMPLFAKDVAKNVNYSLASADALAHLSDASVDYVFTDPPFGSNIFYSDMNLFQEAWLGTSTANAREAVMHTTGKKKNGAAERYESLLRGAFEEAFRVLKPGAHMSVVFGNSNGAIWSLVQRALRDAGFGAVPVHVAILDKGQRSVKGLNSGSEGVVTVDLVLTVQKPADAKAAKSVVASIQGNPSELLEAALRGLPEDKAKNPSYVYAATVREAIRRHEAVEHLHLGDVLIALRNAGYVLDPKSGLLNKPASAQAITLKSKGPKSKGHAASANP